MACYMFLCKMSVSASVELNDDSPQESGGKMPGTDILNRLRAREIN